MKKRFIALFLILSLSLSLMPIIYAAKSVSQLKEDLAKNQQKVEQTQKEIKEKQAEQSEQKKKKVAIDIEIAGLQEDIDAVEGAIEEKNAEIEAKNAEIAALDVSIKETKEMLDKRMRVMYENGSSSYLEILLNSDGMSDLYTRMYIIEAIVEHDNGLISDYKNQIKQLEDAKKTIETEKEEQIEAKEILEEKKAVIREKQKEQQAIINELNKDINELKRQEAEMEKAEKQIEAQIKAALESADQKNVTYKGNGKFILPLASYTRISDQYGLREKHPITGKRTMHKGIDYAAPHGTAIFAAEDGVVLTSGWINGYGYTVTINHGGGYVTLYAHCSTLIAKAGQKVTKGETIARVGSTGNSTGNHLHFEVKVNGTAQDPRKYL